MLGLLVRALRWRAGATAAVLVVATIAGLAATLGPLYARSTEESLVLDRVARAGPGTTAVEVTASTVAQLPGVSGQSAKLDAVALADAMRGQLAAQTRLDADFGPIGSWITVPPVVVTAAGREPAEARTSWHPGACAGVHVVAGRCLAGPDDALVATRTLNTLRLHLGDRLRIALDGPPDPGDAAAAARDEVTIVGAYDVTSAQPQVWGSRPPAQYRDPPVGPAELDEILLDRGRIARAARAGRETSTTAFRLLRPGLPSAAAVDAASAQAAAAVEDLTQQESAALTGAPHGQPVSTASSSLPAFLDGLAPERRQVRTVTFAVTAQLVLLAWFVLYLVVSAGTEERAGELALAKLRGLGPARLLGFGLAEIAVVLAVAAPLGLLGALLVDRWLVAAVPLPRAGASVDAATLLAGIAGFAGGLVAAAIALRRVVTAPVLDQLKRSGGTRAALARSVAVDTTAVAVAVVGVYLLRRGEDDPVALVTPGLLALGAGLLAVRVLPLAARAGVRRTGASPRVASFLAVRNVARRPGGARLVVLLTVATTLGVFAVTTWTISKDVRSDRARAEVGAVTVLHVAPVQPAKLLELVRRADPDGRWAMAAGQLGRGAATPVLAVDTTRFAAVTSWDPAWAGTDMTALTRALKPAVQPSVAVRDRLAVSATALPAAGSPPVHLVALLERPDGVRLEADAGPLAAGNHTYAVPAACPGTCRLVALALRGEGLGNAYSAGSLVVSRITDGAGPVAARLTTPEAWRVVPRQGSTGTGSDDQRRADVGADGLHVQYQGLIANDDVEVEVADHPATLAALAGSALDPPFTEASREVFLAPGLGGGTVPARLAGTGDLPRVGRAGYLVDLAFAADAAPGLMGDVDPQVWLGENAPPGALDALRAAGARVVATETVAARRGELGRDASSLALLLSLVAAALAALLAVGTVLATAYVGGRRRSYELAALRSLGAAPRVLVRAGRREQLLLVVTGAVLGAVVGVAATYAALNALPAVTSAGIAPAVRGPRLLPVVAVVCAVLLLVALVAHLGARRVVAAATADLLREDQA
jgi:putative ABC transport system permease protein